MTIVRVIGGGLAGCEAAYQLLKRGYKVELYEMRKVKLTPAHHTDCLAELVCSNSLKSMSDDTASGALKLELGVMDCMLLRAAKKAAVPAGSALAVDRLAFSAEVEDCLNSYPNFVRIDQEVTEIDMEIPTIIATGPLTSEGLAATIANIIGEDKNMYFFDAAAPIISADSIDHDKAFYAVRYNKGDSTDYLNCGMNKQEYTDFYNELVAAEVANMHDFDRREYFEGCMPVEVMARRGFDTIRYGMMKPKGIVNPNNDERYFAVLQLRKENQHGTAYNMVGFQTNLKFAEQKRVFGMIPALRDAEFLRYGVMHRNTYLNSPQILAPTGKLKGSKSIYFAGQITGVEGYVESIMSGVIAAINLDRQLTGQGEYIAPSTTITGALQRHISTPCDTFQPMNANFGILPPLEVSARDKKVRKALYAQRCLGDTIAP